MPELRRKLRLAMFACVLATSMPATVGAAVQVIVGPTPIRDGEARSAGDLTVVNEKLAFALAVGSPVPYGVRRVERSSTWPRW